MTPLLNLLLVLPLLAQGGSDPSAREQFKKFKVKFSKVYTSSQEEEARFAVFSEKLLRIEEHNSKTGVTYTKGVTQFSDRTSEEFLGQQTYRPIPQGPRKSAFNSSGSLLRLDQLPEEVDWRNQGVVSPVVNQWACGSCWAFATVAQLESYTALAGGKLEVLSAEQITACAPNPLQCGGGGGCLGSVEQLAYNYAQLFGVTTEAQYPYNSGTGLEDHPTCLYDLKDTPPVVSISGYNTLPSNDYLAVMNHLATVGPLAVAVAVSSSWEDYFNGVLNCGYQHNIGLNHAVQLVGYGVDYYHGDYWLVRNSWGDSWGMDGYVRLGRIDPDSCGHNDEPMDGTACVGGPGSNGQNQVCGECGILFEATYPLGARHL